MSIFKTQAPAKATRSGQSVTPFTGHSPRPNNPLSGTPKPMAEVPNPLMPVDNLPNKGGKS